MITVNNNNNNIGEVMANRADIIIKNKKRENVHTSRHGNTSEEKHQAKASRK
jgi:hypothetical protein